MTKLKPLKKRCFLNGATMVQDSDKMWQAYSRSGRPIGDRTTETDAKLRALRSDVFEENQQAFWKIMGDEPYTPCEAALLRYFDWKKS